MSANRRTVLYVEDEECDRMFMEVAFGKAGISSVLRTVENGQAAQDYLAGRGAYADRTQHPLPDLVLLDLHMPLIGGLEVLEWMRQRPELTSLPVVIFTSSTEEDDTARAKKLGASDFLEKPQSLVKFGEVAERVKTNWFGRVTGRS